MMRVLAICAVILFRLFGSVAHADPRAEALNKEGIKAAKSNDWELARQKFDESYNLEQKPKTLYNLAAAEEQTEKHVAARKNYNKFLQLSTAPEEENLRKIAQGKLNDLDAKLATLRIHTTFPDDVAIEIDGRAIDDTERATAVLVDPGEHILVAKKGNEVLTKRSVMVSAGSHGEAELSPATTTSVPDPNTVKPKRETTQQTGQQQIVTPKPFHKDEGSHVPGFLKSPWFWGITTVVVLGAATGGYYEFTTHAPQTGTLGPGVIETR